VERQSTAQSTSSESQKAADAEFALNRAVRSDCQCKKYIPVPSPRSAGLLEEECCYRFGARNWARDAVNAGITLSCFGNPGLTGIQTAGSR